MRPGAFMTFKLKMLAFAGSLSISYWRRSGSKKSCEIGSRIVA
jgi:hypothetical protein